MGLYNSTPCPHCHSHRQSESLTDSPSKTFRQDLDGIITTFRAHYVEAGLLRANAHTAVDSSLPTLLHAMAKEGQ
jgi:hypothetical protein